MEKSFALKVAVRIIHSINIFNIKNQKMIVQKYAINLVLIFLELDLKKITFAMKMILILRKLVIITIIRFNMKVSN